MNFCDFLALTKSNDSLARKLLTNIDSWKLPFGYRYKDIDRQLRDRGAPKEERNHIFQLYLEFDSWKDEMRKAAERDPLVRDDFMRLYRPYCFHKLDLPGHVWLPLTRDYKPFGVARDKHVQYEDFAHQAVVFARDPAKFRGIWLHDRGVSRKWLYDDGPWPAADYYGRLAKLERQKHRVVGSRDATTWASMRPNQAEVLVY